MEFLPTNLTSCIEQYGILPEEMNHSVLYDVALGLCYLHNQIPPIIHRDLSSNNVLLTSNMSAKISDLGVARILNMTQGSMTQTPGTPAYNMPPEVMKANPNYTTSIDVFSYGILMIHVLSEQWPEPQIEQIRNEPGKLVPITEAERRDVSLQAIGRDHCLMGLILKCIDNYPQARAHASEIVKHLAKTQYVCTFDVNHLELMRHIKAKEEEKFALGKEGENKNKVIQQQEEYIQELEKKAQLAEKYQAEKMDRLRLIHSSEVKQLQMQIRDLEICIHQIKMENKTKLEELEAKAEMDEAKIKKNGKERKHYEMLLANERKEFEVQLAREREANRK